MNRSDSERIAFYLESYGFKKVDDWHGAGLIIVVTCGIRQAAEDRNYGLFPKFKKENPGAKTVLTGCLSKREDVKKRLDKHVDIWLPIEELPFLYERLGLRNKKMSAKDYFKISPRAESDFSIFIPVGNGCNNFCSYCVVPYARGKERYRPVSDIIKEIRSFVKKGYKEIVLIAQNVNSYKDPNKGFGFPELLKRASDVKGNFWVRFASSHPKDLSDELIKVVAENEKLCDHFHFALQSGDDEILRMMNRKYTADQYKKSVDKIKKSIPGVSISTDIIVGFPGENKKQFGNTAKLCREVGFDMIYIARFSPRPGTVAARLEDNVSLKEKKGREEILSSIMKRGNLRNNKRYIGKSVKVLIENKKKNGLWFGRDEHNKIVMIEKSQRIKALKGKFVMVRISKAYNLGMIGLLE